MINKKQKNTSLLRFGTFSDDDDGNVNCGLVNSLSIEPFDVSDSFDLTISLTICNFGGGYRGGALTVSTKLSGTSIGRS